MPHPWVPLLPLAVQWLGPRDLASAAVQKRVQRGSTALLQRATGENPFAGAASAAGTHPMPNGSAAVTPS